MPSINDTSAMQVFTKSFTMTREVLFLFFSFSLLGRGEASVTCATGHYRTGFSHTQRWWTYSDGSTNQNPPYYNNYCGAGAGTIKTGTTIRVYNNNEVTNVDKQQTCSRACAADGKKFSYYLRGDNVWPDPNNNNNFYQDYQCYCASTCSITYLSNPSVSTGYPAYLYEASAQCAPVTVFSCDAGEFFTENTVTADATCSPCEAGTFQGNDGSTATSCLPCSNTSEYSTGGAATCTSTLASCDKGHRFVDGLAVAENQCIACEPGYAQPSNSTRVIQCTPCPAGEFQNQSAADSCEICPTGTYASSGATTQCTQKTVCEAPAYYIGTDGGLIADDDCACSSGFKVSTDSNGLYYCKRCEAGLVNEAGDFPSSNALTTCDTCEVDSEANAQNSSCVCKDGHYFDLTQCTACSAGTYRAGGDSVHGTATTCDACPAEHFSLGTAKECTAWSKCPAGEYLASPSATQDGTCTPCTAGTFQSDSDSIAQSCTACDYNTHSAEGASSCTPWTECTGDTHYNGNRITGEEHCDANYVCSLNSTEHTAPTSTSDRICACDAGHSFSDGYVSDVLKCQPCPIGTSRAGGDLSNNSATTCAPCAAGSFSDETATATCTPYTDANCDKGFELVTSAGNAPVLTEDASCSACVQGKWQPLDSTLNLCQPHTDFGCDASTEVGNGTSSVDSVQCVCKGGHRFNAYQGLVATDTTSVEIASHATETMSVRDVQYFSDGGYAVVWHQSVSGYATPFIQFYNADGTRRYEEYSPHSVYAASSAHISRVIVFSDDTVHLLTSRYDNTVYVQKFNNDGSKDGSVTNFQTNAFKFSVAKHTTDKYVFVYIDLHSTYTNYVRAITVSKSLGTSNHKYVLSSQATEIDVSLLSDGNYAVLYNYKQWYSGGWYNFKLRLQLIYSSNNENLGSDTSLTSLESEGYDRYPRVLGLTNGNIVAVYEYHWDRKVKKGQIVQFSQNSFQTVKTEFTMVTSDYNSHWLDFVEIEKELLVSNRKSINGLQTVLIARFSLNGDSLGSEMTVIQENVASSERFVVQDKKFLVVCTGDKKVLAKRWVYEYPQCETCLAGTFRKQGDLVDGPTTVCDACPAKTYSTGTAAECTGWAPCPAGFYNTIDSATQDSTCGVCPANTYTGTSNTLTACLAHKTECPIGEQLKGSGNTTHDKECEGCPAGTFQASASGAPCATWRTTCDKGTQIENDGSSTQDRSCSTCVAGKFQPIDATANACEDYRTSCPPGFALQDDGTTETDRTCQACPIGEYKTLNDGSDCLSCQDAYEVIPINATEGATDCVACDVATEYDHDNLAHTGCVTTTNVCPINFELVITAGNASNLCDACLPGSEQLETDSTAQCKECSEGYFSSNGHACIVHSDTPASCNSVRKPFIAGNASTDTSCGDTCSNLQYASGAACVDYAVLSCPSGKEFKSGGTSTENSCISCEAGTFQSSNNSITACSACPANTFSTGGAAFCENTLASCDKGHRFVDGLAVAPNQCIACQPGYAQPSNSTRVIQCTPCPVGEFQSKPASESCDDCPTGTYASGGATTECTQKTKCEAPAYFIGTDGGRVADDDCACSSGYYVDTDSEGFYYCKRCEAGFVNAAGDLPSKNAVTSCDTCVANSDANAQNSSCVCKDGHYFDLTQCTACTAGTYRVGGDSVDGSATTCDACPYNTHSTEGASSCSAWTECTGDTHYNGNRITGEEHCDANYVCPANSSEYLAPTTTSDRICACNAGHSFDGSVCQACPIGTFRKAGDFLNSTEMSCVACESGSFSDKTGAATCSPYTDANCSKGFELVTSGGHAPKVTEDAFCSACVEGKWQGLDYTTNLCQPHTDLGCDDGTEVSDGTSGVDSTQCFCKDGHRFNLTHCVPCASGTFRLGKDSKTGNATTCEACPAKTYSTGTAVECTPWTECPAGYYNTINSLSQDSTCGACPENTYVGTSNTLTACLAQKTECPIGEQLTAGNTTHDKECEGCPAGTFQASASGAPCATWRTTCDKGTQIENDGSSTQDRSCSTCVAGKFQPLDGSANACGDYRTSCPPGFVLQDDGTTETDRTCQPCPEGTFKVDHGDHSCILKKSTCPAGTQLEVNADTDKDNDCKLCPKGTYQPTEGNENCALCEAGKEVTPLNALEGATGCIACVQATHIDYDGASHTACELLTGDKCPAGMGYLVTDASKPNLCLPCAAGKFQPIDGSKDACTTHTVTTCPAGQQLKADTASTDSVCEPCPSGTYKSGSGADACTPWLYEVCEVGYERTSAPSATQDGACTACASGYFNNGKNADACKEHREVCPAGFGLVAGTAEADATCQSCGSGTFSANLDGGACVAHRSSCAAGEALGTDGSTSKDHSCTPCSEGSYNTDGITCIPHTVTSCPAGKGFLGSATVDGSCSDCVDSYQPNADSTAACKAWTVCDPSTEIETQAPSTIQDRVCGCAEGHRFDKALQTCIACSGNLKRAAGDVKFVAAQLN